MSKAPPRQPIEARGAALLSLIAAGGDNGLMLTSAEGMDAVNAGHVIVDTSVIKDDTAKVTLTEAGRAALTGTGGGNATGSKYEVETEVALPETAKHRRGRVSSYPFDLLASPTEDGKFSSFHVSGDPDKTAAKLLSSAASARSRFVTDHPTDTRSVKVREYHKDDEGKFVKDAQGKRIVLSETDGTKPTRIVNRDFKVLPVDASDPKGPGARVWRVK